MIVHIVMNDSIEINVTETDKPGTKHPPKFLVVLN